MAPPLEDLTGVLAELAARLSRSPTGGGSASAGDALLASISSLAAALNPNGGRGGASSGTRVLDAALSLMCFDPIEARQPPGRVNKARVDCLVRTLVSALSASVSCRVVRPDGSFGEEMLCVGSSVSPADCCELLRSCAALVEELGDCDAGRHSYDLMYAIARTAVLSPHYQCLFPLPYYKEEGENVYDMGTIAAELINHPSNHVPPSDNSIPLRGLGSVLALYSALVSSALDILLKPMSWGISIELGQKFPFSHVYFPSQHSDLLAILNGPLSCKGFLDLVSCINALVHLDNTRTRCSSLKNSQLQSMKGSVKYNSAWCTIINFPVWFNFATALLFHREGSQNYLSETLSKETVADSIGDVSLAQRAAFYLSWVLCPSNDDQCQVLANNILEISHSWARNNKKRPSYHSSTVNHRRKLRIPTAVDSEKLHVPTNTVSSLIKEFDDRCVKFCTTTAFPQVQAEKLSDFHPSCHNLLHLWIPLGVLLVSSHCVNEQNCDMLLRYTSTGQVLKSNEVGMKTKDHVSDDGLPITCSGTAERWALSGAYLIFVWLDVVEDMSSLIFDCEDRCQHFVSQLRTKTGPYLVKCVELLFEMLDEADLDRNFVIDLHNRLLSWDKNGQGCEIFGDVILKMNKKFKLPL
ncbi:hypothetical protein BAE44_0004631 [Dichanthelium oligosanthes]|uniref:Uncharacterized protein n=1 Tax=Dichanthelium oligosanthes TaxID=888268 RepID=A0A1E5WAS6_9POAL|nr:hypothetical protein BAE44_0004631 [Dichanthelium oligosanthes]